MVLMLAADIPETEAQEEEQLIYSSERQLFNPELSLSAKVTLNMFLNPEMPPIHQE